MSLIGFIILIAVLVIVFGNPHVGTRVYPGYSYGYWPGGIGLIVVIVLVLLLLGGRL
jgi:hypothetical protein